MKKGLFVEVDNVRRIGKIFEYKEYMTSVEFFTSISKREVIEFETSCLRRQYLGPQTRVYFYSDKDAQWNMGRIRDYFFEDDGTVTYEIRFPNKIEMDIPEQDLFVRCFGTFGDPSDVLAIGGAETQLWHDARWPTIEILVSLRSAAVGLTGLTSASVELIPHQVDAVRRVLADPLQRYLLADEVGLGKTVEAAAIIRQVLQDASAQIVLVVVPNSLIRQWKNELQSKFGLDVGDKLIVVDHDTLSNFEGDVDLLVVDEAHRIVRGNTAFESVSRLSKSCKKLLLLSATPLIGNEHTFLDLLRWLDPERWELESLKTFKQHVSRSVEYGRLLLGLRSDASRFNLKQRALGAKEEFPRDVMVQTLADELLNNLDSSDEQMQICSALRDYIADTYRIHHRVVRARRSDLEGWEFQPRGPASVREEPDYGEGVDEVVSLMEDWRGAALIALDNNPSIESNLAERFALLLEKCGRGNSALLTLPALDPLFPNELELLSALRSCATPDSDDFRAEFIAKIAQSQVKFLQNSNSEPKLVIFATENRFAAAIFDKLVEKFGVDAIVTTSYNGETDTLKRFERDPQAVIAVFDESGEEGINLHFANTILHADLPFSISRLEQRIGRLDRFGRTKGPIKHVVVIPDGDENTPWSIWFELLVSGIEVFDRSVSDLQLVVERIEREIWHQLLINGANGVEEYASELKAQLSIERQRLDEQYALDQLAMSREPANALIESMEEVESNENLLAEKIETLLGKFLQFHIYRKNNELILNWTDRVLLPEQFWRPVFDAAMQKPLTWKRRIAINRPNVSLLRPGAPLIDALERLLDWDDRGSAFATWRFYRGQGGVGEEKIFFRLCWIVSPGSVSEANLLIGEDAQSIRRKAESFLSSWTLVQHVGTDFVEIRGNGDLDLLETPFNSEENYYTQDFNLSSRPTWLHSVIGVSEFADLCTHIRDYGNEILEGSEVFIDRCRSAITIATLDYQRRQQRRQSRNTREDALANRELIFDNAVLESVKSPEVRLDSVGVIVLAGYIPQREWSCNSRV